MAEVECFWTEPLSLGRRELRRYASRACNVVGSYCNGSVVIGDVPMSPPAREHYDHSPSPEAFSGDPRWPAACEHCGASFGADDPAQVNDHRYYARSAGPGLAPDPDADRWVLRELPAGGMYDAWWMGGHYCGADGISLACILPDGTPWIVDGPASNADPGQPGWGRTGVPPNVTAQPWSPGQAFSVQSPGYHGYLRDGKLVD